jgi:Methyltransferase domain
MFDKAWSRVGAAVTRRIDEVVRLRLDARVEQHEQWLRARLDARVEQHEQWLQGQVDRILDTINDADRRARRDIFQAAEREAARTSARFAYERFPTARTFFDKHATLEHAVKAAPAGGLALEFGVYSGTTLAIIAKLRDGGVYGFDSFEGLPEDWRSTFEAGTFAVDQLPQVPGAELVVGWFDDTLPGFLAEHEGPVSFLHVDGDLYSSARTVLDLCGPRLVAGSIVIFDEYFNFPGWEQHEHRAWEEYVERTGTTFTYEAYTADDEQVVMRITEPGRHG